MDPLSSYSQLAHDSTRPFWMRIGAAVIMWATVLIPYLGLLVVGVYAALGGIDWRPVTLFLGFYLLTGLGITVGFHRLVTHRAFDCPAFVRAFFVIAGSMAGQGPSTKWTALHRRHHQKSDQEGDPHSPHEHGTGPGAWWRGFLHAHTAWLLKADLSGMDRSVKDLLADPMIRTIDRLYPVWIGLSLGLPPLIGYLWFGDALAGFLWGVILRIALVHHSTWSVNSVCHMYGYRSYKAKDESRNHPIVGILALGEGWHNNHHAFPSSARHGLHWWEFDLSYIVIRSLRAVGLAWSVRVPTASERAARREHKHAEQDHVDVPSLAPGAGSVATVAAATVAAAVAGGAMDVQTDTPAPATNSTPA